MGQRSQMYVSFNNGSRANMTKLEFECEIKTAMNKKKGLSFPQKTHHATGVYYAEYRPKFPEESAADFLITHNSVTGKTTLSADTAAVPIIKTYETFDSLLSELKEME